MNAVKQGNAVLESYGYNHRGERVLRTPAGGAAQITLYDEAGQWLGNYSATGLAQQQAIWLDNYPVALINVPATGVPELAYVQPDHLGTPRVVIDPVRNVAIWEWSNKSEVFGNQIPSADPDGDGVALELALRFPGQQATDASGLFYNYQREYDAATGRYTQADPIGLSGGISAYGYSNASPLLAADPLGLEPVFDTSTCGGQLGMVTCDGNGGFLVSVCNSGCDKICTVMHERNHKALLEKRVPNACVGRPKGASPFPKDWEYGGIEHRQLANELECRAYQEQMICATRLRDGGLGGAAVDKAYSRAVKERSNRQCDAFGY